MIEWLREAFEFLTDVRGLIQLGGTLMVCIVVFVETGLFVGFFLPGDSLLVAAGLFAAKGDLDLTALLVLVSLCAVVGDQVGYVIGRTAGQALYSRPDSFFFRKKHLERAHEFYEKYGGKTIVLARFVPIVRTFAPAVAGAAAMNYRKFVTFNILGGVGWVFSMVLVGYFLGLSIPNLDQQIHWVIAIVIFLSILPAILEVLKARRQRAGKPAARISRAQPEQE